jgi:hypothetical protein
MLGMPCGIEFPAPSNMSSFLIDCPLQVCVTDHEDELVRTNVELRSHAVQRKHWTSQFPAATTSADLIGL